MSKKPGRPLADETPTDASSAWAGPVYSETPLTIDEAQDEVTTRQQRGAAIRSLGGAGFDLEELIAVGGFGEIWVATQRSLHRTVAVKRLRRDIIQRLQFDVGALRQYEYAFSHEAVITASLEHPNIVPVHELGLDEDGYPFMAMKLVRGAPWNRMIRAEFNDPVPVFLARHLPVLMSVVQAVAFAHSRGVIHRDIKPSQIMVGEFGEVQLMDWGLAVRVADIDATRSGPPDELLTREGVAPAVLTTCGTVAFMAPEQTARDLTKVTAATDIYLLGATLYYLLTGKAPRQSADASEAWRQAERGAYIPPEERCPGREMPRELLELVRWSMAPSPADRPPTAEIFLGRLRDYVTGEGRQRESARLTAELSPRIAACAGEYEKLEECQNTLQRASRLWPENPDLPAIDHHLRLAYARTALAAGDLGLARLQASRLEHGELRTELLGMIEQAEQRRRRAAERLNIALRDAKGLIQYMLIDMHEGLEAMGRLDLMDGVARRAMQHFDQFPEESGPDDALNRCRTLRKIGDVFRDRGRMEQAKAVLEEALRLGEENRQRAPDTDARWARDTAETCERLSLTLYERGEMERALECARGAVARWDIVAAAPGANGEARRGRARALQHLGYVLWRLGRAEEAMARLEEARTEQCLLMAGGDNSAGTQMEYATTLNTMGWVLRENGDRAGAQRALRECIALRAELIRRHPGNVTIRGAQAWSLRSLGILQEEAGHLTEALHLFRESTEMSRVMSEADPSNMRRQLELAFGINGVGRILHQMGDEVAALEHCAEGTRLQAEALKGAQDSVRYWQEHAMARLVLAEVRAALGQREAALEVAETVANEAERHLAGDVSNPPLTVIHASALVLVGYLRRDLARGPGRGRRRPWRRPVTEAVELIQGLLANGTHPAGVRETLALGLHLLGRNAECREVIEGLRRDGWRSALVERLLRLVPPAGEPTPPRRRAERRTA